jgi:hypothetical protein
MIFMVFFSDLLHFFREFLDYVFQVFHFRVASLFL